jgi:two-component system sensor histidine kinase TctE
LKTRSLEGASLRRRVFLLLLPPIVLLLLGSVVTDLHTALEPANSARDRALADAALAVAGHVQARGNRPHLELSPEAEALLRANTDDAVYYAVFDAQGQLAAGDAGMDPPRARPRPTNPAFYDGEYQGKPVRVVTLRAPTEAGTVVVKVAETTKGHDRLVRRATGTIALSNFLLIALTLVLVYFGVRSGLSPLERIRGEIAARSARDLRPLDDAHVPGEVRPLVEAINRLLALLREAAAAQERFLANAAHQLRTPLAGLQAQLDLLAREGLSEDGRARLNQARDATRRTAHLAHQILSLARADPVSTLSKEFREIELSVLASGSAPAHLDQAIGKDQDLGFDLHIAHIRGVDWLLRELLANLIDNAIGYCPRGTRVTVRTGLRAGAPFLEVEDNGPGIPESERVKVRERFYRVPGTQGTGTGLGLAIVQEIAELHGATLEIGTPVDGTGTRVTVVFPAAPA